MRKLWAAALTLMTSLGMLGYWQTPDEPAATPRPADVLTKKTVEVRVVAQGDEDAAVALREAYDMLRRLRAERLEDRSKELVDRATDLYKEALKSFNSEAKDRQREARGLALAARELARTVERLRDVRLSDRPDPDLPEPPATLERLTTIDLPQRPDVPPPPLPPVLEGGRAVPPAPPAPPVGPTGPPAKTEKRAFVFRAEPLRKGEASRILVQPVPGPEGEKGSRRFEFRIEGDQDLEKVHRGLPEEFRRYYDREGIQREVREQVEKAREAVERAREEAQRGAREGETSAREAAENARQRAQELRDQLRGNYFVTAPGAVGGGFTFGGGPVAAQQALRQAYDRITAARESLENAGDQKAAEEAKFYLDAARDLYNAARRDAEAGRNERAAQLARAAEALTHVPRHLPSLDPGAEADEEPNDDAAESPEAETIEEAVVDESETVVGVGVAMSFEDGALRVLSVVPGSPAAKDGRLKEGDRIVGIEKSEGERVEFEDMELAEIVALIRGEEGTQVRLIVEAKGSDEETVIPLTRARIEVPEQPRAERLELRPLFFDVDGVGVDLFQNRAEPAGAELPPELPE